MSDILVYAQINDGVLNDISLQCLAKARELAAASGAKVSCIAMGSGVSDVAQGLFSHGADAVHVADDARLENYLTTPYKKVLKGFLAQNNFSIVLLPATTSGNDLAPILAAELDASCVIDGNGVQPEGTGITVRRHEFDRKVTTTYAAKGEIPFFVTLKDGVAESTQADGSKTGEIVAVTVELDEADLTSKVLKRDVTAKTVNLKDAKVIVAAGAGVGTKDNFSKVEDLARILGAEIGATRAVVDAGWLPADHQIGQTGATVRPDVYIACGISGAVQHWVGMSDAKTIIAINTDRSAPIMKRAHYQVVGDLNEVLPKLAKLLE